MSAKELAKSILRVVGKIPLLGPLARAAAYPFPKLYIFVSRNTGSPDSVHERVWKVRRGPLAGLKLTNVLPDEIQPVLDNGMEIHCSNLVSRLPLADGVAVDVGGSYGYYALLFSRLVGAGGRVYSFEPDWNTFQKLARNLAINRAENVTAAPLCLSDAQSLARWESFADEPWNSHIVTDSTPAKTDKLLVVPVIRMDDFFNALPKDRKVALVKIDVEGAELFVLKGMAEIFRDSKPAILCEVHGPEILVDVRRFLTEHGYAITLVEYQKETRQHIFAYPKDAAAKFGSVAKEFEVSAPGAKA